MESLKKKPNKRTVVGDIGESPGERQGIETEKDNVSQGTKCVTFTEC